MNQTIAPVRVTGDPRCDELQKRLDTEIAEPTLTFGGDNTYDPDNIQDILHNLRVLGWATWSVPPELRKQRFANLERELHTMRPDQYSLEVEPVSGQRYRWQKDLWGGGATAVDIEWYNGMQLAGLWAGYFYSGDEETFLAKVRARWEIVQDLLRYFEIFDDWPTGLTYTALTRKCLWFDGFNFVWQGVCGAARLARIVGDDETADRAELLAARYSLARSAAWFMLPYTDRHDGFHKQVKQLQTGAQMIEVGPQSPGMGVAGFVEKRGVTVGPWYDPGNMIGYLVPEQLIMQMSIPGVLEMMRRGQYEFLPLHQLDWNYRFHRTPDGKGPSKPHWLYPSHSHFYHLDPQLFVRSILLREPLDTLLSYTAELTGPVMECYLVARSPMVLFPTDVRFRGVTFDAAAGELVVQFEASEGVRAAMEVVFERSVTGVEGAAWETGGGRARVTLEGGEGVKTVKMRFGGQSFAQK
ncbi:MAG: hypothetical protein IT441_07025 [Phycisphaeraceae bacterium]|nr:hypothetical protein [Phycisphaeraceae bacterium]